MEQFGVKEQSLWAKQRKELREQISKKDNHIQELESTLNKVKSDFNSELKSNQSSLLDAQKQNIALTTELNQKKSRIEKLESHSDSLLDQLENTKTSLCKSERSVLELSKSKRMLEMKFSNAEKELLTQLESLQSDNGTLEKELELIKKSNEGELLNGQKLCHKLDSLQADCTKQHSELVNLQREHQECQVKLQLAKKKEQVKVEKL
ncbi:hypothetical protein HDV02_000774, partial [Globomyces sp. JEL0801]